jgi:hypothetical protein
MWRIVVLVSLFAFSPGVSRAQSTCLPPDDYALVLRGFVREIVAATDTGDVSLRVTLGLAKMDSTKVVFVTDNKICNSVAVGYNTAQGTPGLVRQLHVVKAGNVYAAKDPGHMTGEWCPTVSFTSKFKFIKGLLLP